MSSNSPAEDRLFWATKDLTAHILRVAANNGLKAMPRDRFWHDMDALLTLCARPDAPAATYVRIDRRLDTLRGHLVHETGTWSARADVNDPFQPLTTHMLRALKTLGPVVIDRVVMQAMLEGARSAALGCDDRRFRKQSAFDVATIMRKLPSQARPTPSHYDHGEPKRATWQIDSSGVWSPVDSKEFDDGKSGGSSPRLTKAISDDAFWLRQHAPDEGLRDWQIEQRQIFLEVFTQFAHEDIAKRMTESPSFSRLLATALALEHVRIPANIVLEQAAKWFSTFDVDNSDIALQTANSIERAYARCERYGGPVDPSELARLVELDLRTTQLREIYGVESSPSIEAPSRGMRMRM